MVMRPLGIVKEIIEEIGLGIEYCYEDLVFVEKNMFLLQFDDVNHKCINVYFNEECEVETAQSFETLLLSAAVEREFTIDVCGTYDLSQGEHAEEIKIVFNNE